MKFLIDADLPHWMVESLQAAGHDGVHAEDVVLPRTPDRVIAEYARDRGWAILTGDSDFSNIKRFEPREFDGIVVLTIPRQKGASFMRLLLARLLEHLRGVDSIRGQLLIVEIDRIRVRP